MAFEDLEKFQHLVLADPSLQQKLYDLDSKTEFLEQVMLLGSNLGLQFDLEEVDQALQNGSRSWLERWI